MASGTNLDHIVEKLRALPADKVAEVEGYIDMLHDPAAMSDEERSRLDAVLEQGMRELDAGQSVPAEEVFARLRAKRQSTSLRAASWFPTREARH